MKILHALRGLEKTSGISLFLVENAKRQVMIGHEVSILYERYLEYNPDRSVRLYCGKSLCVVDFQPDVVHIHSVWSLFSIRAMLWCLLHKKPFIVSPHGCLMPRVFKKGRLKKLIFYTCLIKPLMRKATAIHVTAEAEKCEVRKLGFKQLCEVVPLGVDASENIALAKTSNLTKTVLFVGRVSEEKGLKNLLEVWNGLKTDGWRLVIAGPDWYGHMGELKGLVARYKLQNVEFPGSVIGVAKEALYREADVFVLPSPMENFSAVVLEALSYGIPTIATDGTPWEELNSENCGWWIGQGVNPLKEALEQAMAMKDSEREELGRNGRALVARKYSWDKVSESLLDLYNRVIPK